MKTSLTCLAILIAALILGNFQGTRLEKLKQQLAPSATAYRSKAFERRSPETAPAYRSKYQRTSTHANAKDVFQTVIENLAGRTQTTTGDMASMTESNKDALKAVLQLDPSGIKELITLISQSKEPALTRNSATKYEQISLCIIALADQGPGEALDYVTNAGKEMDPKIFRDYGTQNWLEYILTRLGYSEPQRALDALLGFSESPTEPWSDESVRSILSRIARQDPGLVLETIDRLPDTKSHYFLESLTYEMDSDDERTALFLAIRHHFHLQPEITKAGLATLNLDSLTDQLDSTDENSGIYLSLRTHFHLEPEMVRSGVMSLKRMKTGLASLFGRFGYHSESPAELRKWADNLGMSDTEKLLVFDSLDRIDITEQDGEEYARWFATFMPESVGRKHLVRKAFHLWYQTEPTEAAAFLAEQGIDLREMNRLGRE